MVAISAQMNSNLMSLLSVGDEVGAAQNRLATGKKVSSPIDNPAVYFRAETYSSRADKLGTVNEQIGLASKNLTTVSNAIDTMYKNLDGTLSSMRDARSKTAGAITAVNTTGNISTTTSIVATRTLAGSLASPNDNTKFQMGDTFAITGTDAATGREQVRWFRAIDAAAKQRTNTGGEIPNPASPNPPTPTLNLTKAIDKDGRYVQSNGNLGQDSTTGNPNTTTALATGENEIQALNFTDMASLQAAINQAFLGMASVAPDTANNMKLTGANATISLSVSQVLNSDPTGGGLDAGATFDFGRLFGAATALSTRSTITGQSTTNTNMASYTWSPTNGSGNTLDSVREIRRQASDTFKQTLYNLSAMINDAANPGFANILKGEKFTVDLNETGEVKQNLKLDALSLQGQFGYNYNSVTDTISTAYTANEFVSSSDLDSAITRTTSFLQTLRMRQNAVLAANTMMTSRLEYNKAQKSNLSDAANSMTAADTAEEAAKLAVLQNQQSFATNNMSMTKQAEQSLLQLLR